MEPKPFEPQPSVDGVTPPATPAPAAETPTLTTPSAPTWPTQTITPDTPPAPSGSNDSSHTTDSQVTGPAVPPAAPAAPTGPVVFSGGPQPPLSNLPLNSASDKPKKKKKWLVIGLVAIIVILAAVATYVFAFYIPNRPQNVWNTGLDRTGTTFSQLVNTATSQDKLNSFQKSEVTGSLDVKSTDGSGSASFAAKFDPNNVDSGFDFNFTQSGQTENMSAKVKAALANGKEYPDLYFQLTGLKQLGLDSYLPGVEAYDGKWITISSDTLKSYVAQTGATSDSSATQAPTAADIAELTKAVTKVTTDYVLTSDPNKAVLSRQSFVGKETTSQGVKAYRYKATINKVHLKLACEALINSVYSTKAFQKLASSDEKTDSAKQSAISDCKSSIDSSTIDQQTFDVWVDAKYKMLHKVRISDKQDAGTYVEFGQSFKGGDTLPLFVTYHGVSDKTDFTWNHELNTKTYKSSGTLNLISNSDGSNVSVKGTYTIAPFNGTIDSAQPAGSVPIEQVLQKLGLDSSSM